MTRKIIISISLFLLTVGVVSAQLTPEESARIDEDVNTLVDELDFGLNIFANPNEGRVWSVFVGESDFYRRELQLRYQRRTGERLRDALLGLGDDDGGDVIRALLLLDQGNLTQVDYAFLAMRGEDTDVPNLNRSVVEMRRQIESGETTYIELAREWNEKYGPGGRYYDGFAGSLDSALESELSGLDESSMRNLLTGQELTNAQILRIRDNNGPSPDELRELLGISELTRTSQPLGQAECGPEGAGYRLCVPFPGQPAVVGGFGDYVRLFYQLALAIAGVVVFVRITYGGIAYMLSAGNIVSQSEARSIITQAIYGLILLFIATIILGIINPNLLRIGSFVQEGTSVINAPPAQQAGQSIFLRPAQQGQGVQVPPEEFVRRRTGESAIAPTTGGVLGGTGIPAAEEPEIIVAPLELR